MQKFCNTTENQAFYRLNVLSHAITEKKSVWRILIGKRFHQVFATRTATITCFYKRMCSSCANEIEDNASTNV
jgi:hypothetical protein